MNKAVFFDRDGIINIDKGYVSRIEDFQFNDEIFEICRFFQVKKYLIIIITNQAGIARGFFSEHDFKNLTKWMCRTFRENSIIISAVFYCPHHPVNGFGDYKRICNCRKPAPGLIFEAKQMFNIDLNKSILIGDKESDILAGKNAKIAANILIGNKISSRKSTNPELCFDSLALFLNYLKDNYDYFKNTPEDFVFWRRN